MPFLKKCHKKIEGFSTIWKRGLSKHFFKKIRAKIRRFVSPAGRSWGASSRSPPPPAECGSIRGLAASGGGSGGGGSWRRRSRERLFCKNVLNLNFILEKPCFEEIMLDAWINNTISYENQVSMKFVDLPKKDLMKVILIRLKRHNCAFSPLPATVSKKMHLMSTDLSSRTPMVRPMV